MNLQKLLEDNRELWQQRTQKEILDRLLLKSEQRSFVRKREEKLVVVFGKPQVGKTTLILSLMGVDENKICEISKILRARSPEGNSSTSTAIIYQRSDDDMFGIGEHRVSDFSTISVHKCNQEEVINYLIKVRKKVEEQSMDNDIVIYLYIPNYFFGDNTEEYRNINILDVPGFESRNQKENNHVEIILNRYMTVATLNIIIRELNDINDLRDFTAPNGDRLDRMLHKYIVITTHSYSMESVIKYFSIEKDRRKETFEEYLKKICDEEFKRIFGDKIPQYYPVDVGQSFSVLLGTKIKDKNDVAYLVDYRNSVFDSIRNTIQEKRGNNFTVWIEEIIGDINYYQKEKLKELEKRIGEINVQILDKDDEKKKKESQLKDIGNNITKYKMKKQQLQDEEKQFTKLDMENCMKVGINNILNEYFTETYKWKSKQFTNNMSDLFAELFEEILCEYLEENVTKLIIFEEIAEEKSYKEKIEVDEQKLRTELDKIMYPHKVCTAINPTNKEKVEIGRQKLQETLWDWHKLFTNDFQKKYDDKIQKVDSDLTKLNIMETVVLKELEQIKQDKSDLEENKKKTLMDKESIKKRCAQDISLLDNFKNIAQKNFQEQRDSVIEKINLCQDSEDKVCYVLLLGLIYKDFERLVIN